MGRGKTRSGRNKKHKLTCSYKHPFETKNDALIARSRMINQGFHPSHIDVYQCKNCHKFHIGRNWHGKK